MRRRKVQRYEDGPRALARLLEQFLISEYGSRKKLNAAMNRIIKKLTA